MSCGGNAAHLGTKTVGAVPNIQGAFSILDIFAYQGRGTGVLYNGSAGEIANYVGAVAMTREYLTMKLDASRVSEVYTDVNKVMTAGVFITYCIKY